MKKINESGSIDLTFIGALVFVAAIGFLVYSRVADTDKVVQDVANTEATASTPTQNNTLSKIAIPELNVAYTPTNNKTEIIASKENSDYEFKSVDLSTKIFLDTFHGDDDNTDRTKGCAAAIATLLIYENSQQIKDSVLPALYSESFNADGAIKEESNFKQLADDRYWIIMNQSQAVCYEEDPQLQITEANKIQKEFESLLST